MRARPKVAQSPIGVSLVSPYRLCMYAGHPLAETPRLGNGTCGHYLCTAPARAIATSLVLTPLVPRRSAARRTFTNIHSSHPSETPSHNQCGGVQEAGRAGREACVARCCHSVQRCAGPPHHGCKFAGLTRQQIFAEPHWTKQTFAMPASEPLTARPCAPLIW
jgi:hypothetical protein